MRFSSKDKATARPSQGGAGGAIADTQDTYSGLELHCGLALAMEIPANSVMDNATASLGSAVVLPGQRLEQVQQFSHVIEV